jgi:hypothetical protein
MATEPKVTSCDFLNRVKSVLSASLQRWDFNDFPEYALDGYRVGVCFANGHSATILYRHGWSVRGDDADLNEWLTNRLEGNVRDEAGNLSKPLQVEEGKYYERRDGRTIGPAKLSHGGGWNLSGYWYFANGEYHESDKSHLYTLIREVPAPVRESAVSP